MEDRERNVPDAEGTEEVEGHKLDPGRADLGLDEERAGDDDVEAHRLGPPGREEFGREEIGREEIGREEIGREEI